MHLKVVAIFLFSVAGLVWTITSNDLRVKLKNGSKLVGRYMRSYSGRPFKAFIGVPYAKPPVGNLRFKNPEPIEKWEGEYEAVEYGAMCSQRNPFFRSYKDEGSEDCLYLNVYAPHTFEEKESVLPVLVFFHGGGFMCGAGDNHLYGPDHFLDHNVVLVTANYRMGPLGFLSTGDKNCPGNFGLKDQALVLKWIHENINRFAGDPESVTVFGGSAGGASTTYLMTSPLTEGLISKAIAMSGTNLGPWSQPAHDGVAQKRATKLARQFDCYKPNNWAQTIDCLRNISATSITAAFYDFFEFDTDPMVAFTPVVEPDLPGAFITKHPRDGLTEFSLKIPLMTGLAFDEGLLKTAAYFNIPELYDDFAKKLDYALPIAFYYDHHSLPVQQAITKQIKEFYFDGNFSKDKETNVTNLFSDGWFLSAMDYYLQMRLAHKDASPTYVYLQTHETSISFTDIFKGDPEKFYGVSHGDEIIYLFSVRGNYFPKTLPTKEDEEMRKSFVKLWVDFARTGNPTPDSSSLPKWYSTKTLPVDYYRLGNFHFENKPMFGMESGGVFEERAKFWRELGAHLPANKSHKDEL